MKIIGIDVGGTNSDAVLLADNEVRHAVKTPTSADTTSGIVTALRQLLAECSEARAGIDAVMIGTTHFTNAVAQRRDLTPVAAVRIGLPATDFLEPFVDWPRDLAQLVDGGHHMLAGGHEFDGRPIVPFDRDGMAKAAKVIRDAGINSVAVCSVFSPLNPECEEEAAAILGEIHPEANVTLSHRLGQISLLPRENVTLLNASLIGLSRRTIGAFTQALAQSGIQSPLYLTQNDGTVMAADYAEIYPVLSFASGPTNSMRGAAFLSGINDAVVIDVGGTTTDVGCLHNGFPREANNVVEVGGVRTLFRMPDLLSLSLGGGTRIDRNPLRIGPQSVGYQLSREAKIFGGDVLTATDVAVAAGLTELGTPERLDDLPPPLARDAVLEMHAMIADAVDRMKTDARVVPAIAVGGGAFLVPPALPGISEVTVVPHHEVANAVGAAIAQVSGEVDQVFRDVDRDEAIARATTLAQQRAVQAGANPASLETVEVEDLPLAYLPGNSLRTRVKVVGDIQS